MVLLVSFTVCVTTSSHLGQKYDNKHHKKCSQALFPYNEVLSLFTTVYHAVIKLHQDVPSCVALSGLLIIDVHQHLDLVILITYQCLNSIFNNILQLDLSCDHLLRLNST